MFRLGSAVLGAIGFQLLHFALETPQMQAAWGWTMEVPSDLGFTCAEGSTIGGAMGAPDEKFICTVKPDSGKECDVSTTNVVCQKTADPDYIFVPTKFAHPTIQPAPCINVGHNPGPNNDNDSVIRWTVVPNCTDAQNDNHSTTVTATTATVTTTSHGHDGHKDEKPSTSGAPMAVAVGAGFAVSLLGL